MRAITGRARRTAAPDRKPPGGSSVLGLYLDNNYTPASMGSISSSANSTVYINGALNNTGNTLSLPNVLGPLTVLGSGSITGGTVAGQASNTLTLSGGTLAGVTIPAGTTVKGSGNFSGVTLAGTLDEAAAGGTVTVTNGLTLNNGTVKLGDALGNVNSALIFQTASQALGGTGTVVFGAGIYNALQVPSGVVLTIAGGVTVHGQSGYITNGGTFVNQGTIAADVAGGTITLNGTNWSNTGTVQALNGGTVYAPNTSSNFASGTLTGGTWQVFANSKLRLVNTAIATNAATILLDGANSNFYGDANTTNALANLATNAAGGSLTIQNGRSLSVPGAFTNAGSLTVGSGSSLTVAGNYSQSAGTTTLNGGALTASTTVSIAGGTLTGTGTVNANVANAGQVSPGLNLGTLSINGTYTQTSTGSLNVELGGLAVGSQYDQVAVSGAATLGGTLNVSVVNGLVIVPGNSFRVLTFSSQSGDFATKTGLDLGNGLHLVPVYDPGDLTLITKGDTTTGLTSSANPAPFGQLVTFTATVNSVPSGGASPTGTVTFTIDGVAQPAVTLSGNQASFSSSMLGVGTHTVSAAYGGEPNYFASTSTTLTETITKVATTTTVSASVSTPVYGQSVTFTATVAATSGTGTPGGTVTFSVDGVAQAPLTLANGQAGLTLATLGAGSHSITASYSGDSNYGSSSSSALSQSVTPAPLTITANNQTKAYGAALPALTAGYSGFVNGDTPASLTTPPTLSTTATAASHVISGGYAITAGGAASPNYTITYVPGTLTVTPVALTISANNQTKVYGAAMPALTVTYSGFVNGDGASSLTTPPTVTTTATAASHVAGGPYAITASGAIDPDYTISYVAGTLTVTPAPLTITANNQTMTYGGALPALTATLTGLVNGDTPATFSAAPNTPPALSTVPATSHAGTCAITVSGAADTDYSITFVNGSLTITPAALTITAANQAKIYGAPLPTLTVSYSGFVNGDSAASLTTAPTVTTTATAASHVAGSPYPITASGAADPDYTITYVAGSLTVTPAPLTITADNQAKVYGAPLPTFTASYSGFVLGDTPGVLSGTLTFSTTATASSPVGTYAITPAGQTSTDYAITYGNGTLTINPANTTTALSSSANPSLAGQAVTFTAAVSAVAPGAGTPTGTVTFTIDGTAQTPATLSGGQATFTTTSLAPGSHAVTASYNGDGNFTASNSGTLTQTVNGSTLRITSLSPASVAEGSPAFTLTVTGTGFAGNFLVQWNGSPLATTFVSGTQLRAAVPAGKVADEGTANVTVVNPAPGGGTSNALVFTITDAVPVVGAITAPAAPVAVNTAITAGASFTDAGTLDTHTAIWNWGDGTTSAGTVTERNGSGSVGGRHTYTTAGLYTVTLTVTDDDGVAGRATFSYVVAFNKAAGPVAGAGSFTSRAGDYVPNPTLTGTVSFALGAGFPSDSTIPVGLTEVWFAAANLHLQSTGYDWLVINGGQALYRGSGTINGTGNYGFVVAAVDGQFNGGHSPDAIRLRIWDKAHGNAVVYDTQPGAAVPTSPTTTLDSGRILIYPDVDTALTGGGRNTDPRADATAFATPDGPSAPTPALSGSNPFTTSSPGTAPALTGSDQPLPAWPLTGGDGSAGAPHDFIFANPLDGLFRETVHEDAVLAEFFPSLGLSSKVDR